MINQDKLKAKARRAQAERRRILDEIAQEHGFATWSKMVTAIKNKEIEITVKRKESDAQ